MAEEFDAAAMIQRFQERARSVKRRGIPPVEGPDLDTQLEALLHQVWEEEHAWRDEDRIDLAARLYRES